MDDENIFMKSDDDDYSPLDFSHEPEPRDWGAPDGGDNEE